MIVCTKHILQDRLTLHNLEDEKKTLVHVQLKTDSAGLGTQCPGRGKKGAASQFNSDDGFHILCHRQAQKGGHLS